MSALLKEGADIVSKSTCILLDIEGTTSSVDFVRKVLFPYGEQHISDYIRAHWNDEKVQEVVLDLQNQDIIEKDQLADHLHGDHHQENIIAKLLNQMKTGKKSKAVKGLEGLVWKNGYITGEIIGNVYPDVIQAFELWKKQGKHICIYSTGSVEAQKLLFKYSSYGDLGKYIDKYFDTNMGSKLESTSYSKICEEIQRLPNEVVFFSDRPQELFAAKQCGLNGFLVVRDPDHPMFTDELNGITFADPIVHMLSDVLDERYNQNV